MNTQKYQVLLVVVPFLILLAAGVFVGWKYQAVDRENQRWTAAYESIQPGMLRSDVMQRFTDLKPLKITDYPNGTYVFGPNSQVYAFRFGGGGRVRGKARGQRERDGGVSIHPENWR
jgi:hypothetical protein